MGIILLWIAASAGLCAFGFLLAGALSFYEYDKPFTRVGSWLFLADVFVSAGLLTMLVTIIRNWRKKPESRRLVRIGTICAAFAVLVGYLGVKL